MSRIQSSVGLITGIPIQETVNQLMAVAARPKDMLSNRTKLLESEKLAVTQLTSLLVAFQFEAKQLGSAGLFDSKQASSSNSAALTAAVASGANPAAGNYLFTPVRTASAQQFLSRSFAPDAAVGAGSFTFQVGGFVDQGIALEELNGGAGVERGKIRITDRSGASALVDLSFARSVDDVLKAISGNTSINVTAVADGDAIRLVDHSGGSGNLVVQNVAGGNTATHLGLASINVAAAEATGTDIFTLHAQTRLSFLNDSGGVQLIEGADDLSISFADESTLLVDLSGAVTLGDVLAKLNAAAPAKLSAAIAGDGNRLELTDLTAGGGTFAVANVGSGTAANDLRLTTTAAGDTLTGGRLASGLRDTLLSSLNGGRGLGTLGEIDFTNRNNVSSTVNLAGAETLGQIVAAINAQAVGVTASINAARNGIQLVDTTGATLSSLIVADGDIQASATALGLAGTSTSGSLNGGALRRQTVSQATLLSSLNGGKGVKLGDFTITDSAGNLGAVDLNTLGDEAKTLGDVIRRINALANVGVEARINDAGDGILLVDTAGGGSPLKVADVAGGTAAKQLRLLGSSVEVEIEGVPTQVIDGTAAVKVEIGTDDTLADIVKTINALGRGVTASLLNDGSGRRLSLTVDSPGEANAILLDATDSALALQEVTAARDALLLYGSGGASAGSILIASPTNQFTGVVDGVNLTVNQGSIDPVTVSVKSSSTALVNGVQEFVDAYNSIRKTLDDLTDFDQEELTTGILFGTREALRVESDLARLVTSRYFGVGQIQSLEEVGISLTDTGMIELDKAKLTAAFNDRPEALRTFFTDEKLGLAVKLEAAVEQLAGKSNSVLSARTESLTRNIETNTDRLTAMTDRLARQRERMLAEFFRIESTIARLQESLSALASFQPIAPITSLRSR